MSEIILSSVSEKFLEVLSKVDGVKQPVNAHARIYPAKFTKYLFFIVIGLSPPVHRMLRIGRQGVIKCIDRCPDQN